MNTSGTSLSTASNYTPSGLPSSTTDVLFDSGSAYAGSYSVGTASTNGTLNLRSLNFLNTGVTIVGLASSTTALNFTGAGGDSVSGANAADVIYVSTGSQTITTAAAKVISITLSGTGGNFDIGSGAYFNTNAVISGTGGLNKTGAGTVILGATNTFSGGVRITSGTLQVNGSLGANNVVDNGTLVANRTAGLTISGILSGNGLFNVTANTFMTGANTFTGSTTITSGTLTLGSSTTGGSTGSYVGDILDNSTLQFTRTNSYTYAGNISGAGNLLESGTAGAYTILTGSNSYGGATTVSSGILEFGGTSSLPNAAKLTVNSGATVAVSGSTASNSTTWTSTNLTSLLSTGTLTAGSSLGIDVVSGTFSYGTDIGATNKAGSGIGFTKLGAGQVTLGGAQSYTGLTSVAAGILELSSTLPNLANVNVASGATLGVDTANWTTSNITTLLSSGTFNAGSLLGLDVGSGTFTLAAGITSALSGSNIALNKLGGGTLLVTSPLSYAATTVITGGALQLGDGTHDASITGPTLDNSQLIFDNSGSISTGGIISGTGSVVFNGTGTTSISTNNSFTGGATVNAGLINMSNVNALGGSGTGALVFNSGMIDVGGSVGAGGATIGSINGTGGILTNTGTSNKNITFDNGSSTGTNVWAGSIMTGTSALTSLPVTENVFFGNIGVTYTQLLTGSSNYTGSTQMRSGTVILGNNNALSNTLISFGSTLGDADNRAVLAGSDTSGFVFSNRITVSGNGTTNVDTGTNTLGGLNTSGTDTWTGNITLGTTTTTSSTAGGLTNPFIMTSATGGTQLYSGTILSGTNTSGSLNAVVQIDGGGTTIFSGSNSYSGTTVVNNGTLVLGNSGSAGSIATNVTVNSAGTLAFNRSDSYNFANTISGSGGVTQMGSGTTTLSVANSYTGATTVSAGTLLVTSTSGAGTGAVNLSGGTLNVNTGVSAGLANSSVTFTSEASSYILQRATGNNYNVYKALSDLAPSDARNTTASIRDGTASGATSVTTSFKTIAVATNDSQRVSDVFSLAGTNTDTITIQLALTTAIDSTDYLGSLSGGKWVNTTSLNTGSGALAGSYTMSYDAFLAANGGSFNATTMLGAFGVDASNGTVWAVIDHNSDFAIIGAAAPEPSTYALIALGLGIILIARRRRQAA